MELDGIEVLEENKLWIYSSNNIKEAEDKIKEMVEEEDTTIDFSQQEYVTIPEDEESLDNRALEEQMKFVDFNQLNNI